MDKVEETEDGYYEQVGDVLEWKWKKGHEPGAMGVKLVAAEDAPQDVPNSTATASAVVAPKRKTTRRKK